MSAQLDVFDVLDMIGREAEDRCVWDQLSAAWAALTLGYTGPDTPSSSKSKPTPTGAMCSRDTGQACPDTTTCAPSTAPNGTDALTYSAAASRAKTYQSLADAQASPVRNQASSTNSHGSQMELLPPAVSFYSKTWPASCPVTAAEISPSFSRRWPTSGFTTSPGEFWIANTSECPNGGGASSSLQDVIVADCAPRFYLSRKAAAGILTRAARRNRALPTELRTALDVLSRGATADATTETPTISLSRAPSRRTAAETTSKTITSSRPRSTSEPAGPTKTRPAAANLSSPTRSPVEASPSLTSQPPKADNLSSEPAPATPTWPAPSPPTEPAALTPPNLTVPGPSSSGASPETTSAPSAITRPPSEPDTNRSSVRRLTPTECERLQGFPDGWTIL